MESERPGFNGDRRRRNFWWEQIKELLTTGDWPAALAERCGISGDIALRREDVYLARSLGSAASLRVAFASDFHAGPTTPDRILDDAAALLRNAEPDLLLLGGDFVSHRPHYVNRVAERLGAIPAPAGRFAVLGNHDYWADAAPVVRELERAGIEVLVNANRRLPHPFEQVTVCGLDDHIAGQPDADATFAGATPVRLLLMHAPSGLLDSGRNSFSIAFAGHTHGGQIALPNGYAPYVPYGQLSRQYCAGRFDLETERVLLVSRGVGCSIVPIRWNAPAEVHLCTLHCSSSPLR